MAQEYVFRFLSGRPADLAKKLDRTPAKLVLYDGVRDDSQFRAELEQLDVFADLPAARRLVERFRRSPAFVRTPADLAFDARPGLDWALANAKRLATDAQVKSGLEAAYSIDIAKLVDDRALHESLRRLADTLLAQTVAPSREDVDLDGLTTVYKLLMFIVEVARGPDLPAQATVGDLVGLRTLIVPAVGKLRPQPPDQPAPIPASPAPGPDDRAALVPELADLEQAHGELAALATDPAAVASQPIAVGTSDRVAALEAQLQACRDAARGAQADRDSAAAAAGAPTMVRTPVGVELTADAARSLSAASERAMAALKLDVSSLDPVEAVRQIERRIAGVSARLATAEAPTTMIMLAGTQIEE
jgi:hypothetical protein